MADYSLKRYPIVGACGLDCGLCPRYYTDGPSRCPGCGGPDFFNKHPSCGFITCCVKEKGLESCGQCRDLKNCPKVLKSLEAAKECDSFISYKPLAGNLTFIRDKGIEEFVRLEKEKVRFLKELLERYNDGRSKSFLCLSCQLLPLHNLKDAIRFIKDCIPEGTDVKEKARVVRAAISELAETLGISLKLRK
jgi:hypothetical protein